MKILKSSTFFEHTLAKADILVLAGPSGTGKTEITLNLATFFDQVTVVDLDFSKGDFTLRSERFQAPVPIPQKRSPKRYADTTWMEQEILQLISQAGSQSRVLIDLGGNERGLRFFQMLKPLLYSKNWHLSLVVNFSRPFFQKEENYYAFVRHTEETLELRYHSLIANTHLLEWTRWTTLRESWERTKHLSENLSLPLFFVTIWGKALPLQSFWECFDEAIVVIERFISLPWEES
ncbi:MAG: hypothetical protein ACUVRN_05620 [Candidatus Caldatribacteriaceae bacterium]